MELGKIGYIANVSFWHHIKPREGLKDEQCLVDHFHLESEVHVTVDEDNNSFLDVKEVKDIVNKLLDTFRAPMPRPLKELQELADKSGNVGQAGSLHKPESVKSMNEALNIEDASAEWFTKWIRDQVRLTLHQNFYGYRNVHVWFRETEKYFFES